MKTRDDGRIRLTQSLLDECQNNDLVSYVGLQIKSPRVAAAIAEHYAWRQRFYPVTRTWRKEVGPQDPEFVGIPLGEGIYRLDPDAKIERNIVDVFALKQNLSGILSVELPNGKSCCVSSCACHVDCRGFWYMQPNGIKMLKPNLSIVYGKLVGVRFEID